MGDVLIRNVRDDVIDAWKQRAAGNGRSLQAELEDLLVRSVETDRRAALLETVREIAASADMSKMDRQSWEWIREDRDAR
jgi:antitoxin FitA